jgi:DNA-binding response OmpR family regulator
LSAAQWSLLVVDDNEDNRYTLTRRLQREGYANLTTAADGGEALALLRARPFDLVLLDVMMPGLNGYEVLERMRADARLRHVPVIMISALDEIDSVIRCIELGAEDYLSKPFNPTLLRARVGACLEKKRLRDDIMRAMQRMERELDKAREIQLSMVPREFPHPSKYSRCSSRRGKPVGISTTVSGSRRGNCASPWATSRTRARPPRSTWHAPRPCCG